MKFCCAACGYTISKPVSDPFKQGGEWSETPNPPICPRCDKDNSEEFRAAMLAWISKGVQ